MPRRALLSAVLATALAQAAVTRIEVIERADLPVFNYESITGKAYFAIDAKLEINKIITDDALAPRNAKGLVECSTDGFVLRPRDPTKGNGSALLEISK